MPSGQEDRIMATPRKSGDERMVSRTYRAAIRIGEDFITTVKGVGYKFSLA